MNAPSRRSRQWLRWDLCTAPRHLGLTLLIALSAVACTTTESPPQVVRDLRGATESGGARRDSPQSASQRADSREAAAFAGTAKTDTEERRRAQIRLELASGFYQQGNYTQALEELRTALASDPSYAQAYGLLGLVYLDLRERERAEESFQRALQLAPEDSEILNNYGWFLCQTGRPREAIAQFQASVKNPLYATPARPLHNAGICSLRAGDEVGAEAYFQRAFQLDPRNPVSMYHLGEIYLKRNELERARFHSQRLLASYPPSAETLWLAIRVERKAGERDSAASLSSQLRRQFPTSREANLLQRGAFGD
jgi:type IV pilus assembly protein PilF